MSAGTSGGPFLDEVARRLALGIACTCLVIDPPLVVLAGPVGSAGGMLLANMVQHEVAAIAPVAPRVVTTGVPADPVLHGALLSGLRTAREELLRTIMTAA